MATQARMANGWFATGNGIAHREVPVAPLREAFLASGLTQSDVARRLGWFRHDRPGRPDVTRFARAIGLKPHLNGSHEWAYRQTTTYDRAVEIAAALGFDPVDLDL